MKAGRVSALFAATAAALLLVSGSTDAQSTTGAPPQTPPVSTTPPASSSVPTSVPTPPASTSDTTPVTTALPVAEPATSTASPASPAKAPAKTTAKPPVKAVQTTVTRPATRASVSRALAAERARMDARRREQQAGKAMFTRDAQGNLIPEVRAASAIIYDPKSGDILWDQNSREERSIASLTKVMTAVAFVADSPDLTQRVTVTRADTRSASTTYLKTGDRVTYGDLLHLALIASDNAAARVLARTSEGGTAAFVARMNEWAGPAKLNLTNTHYVDPSGLNADNVSSAFDLSRLIAYASSLDQLGPIMRTPEYVVRTPTREFSIHSTNRLLATAVGNEVLGAKTGFISKSGYCLATLLQMPQGSRVAVVVLGAATSTTRFNEALNLFNWIRGKSLGIDGGDPLPIY